MIAKKRDLNWMSPHRMVDILFMCDREPKGVRLWAPGSSGNNSKNRPAFTLIELLAVIAVVAILAAVLMGAIGKITARAQEAKCAGNLRQIGAAFGLYQFDNNGRLPEVYFSTPDETDPARINQWWRETSVAAYLSDKANSVSIRKYFECPSNNGPAIIDYCYNSGYEFKFASDVPPDAVIVTENRGQAGGIAYNSTYWWPAVGFWHPASSDRDAALDDIENERIRAAALHMDGHVEYLTPADLLERSNR